MSAEVSVVAVGARTPVGLRAESTAAAVRAGISRLSEHPTLIGAGGEPLRCAYDALLAATLRCSSRMGELAIAALTETLAKLPGGGGPTVPVHLFLAFPDARPGFGKHETE